MYTLQANQLTAQDFSGIQALPTQAYYLRILGTTPWAELMGWSVGTNREPRSLKRFR